MGADDGLKPILDKYKNQPQLRHQHSITIPSRRSALEDVKSMDDDAAMRASAALGNDRNPAPEQPRLQLFFSGTDDDTRVVAGFGWMNDSQFIYGQYETEDINFSNPLAFNRLILKKD